tara:strand:- start:1965 stop:2378 length:414 start_codon:yes stop_codon:yes gene_type:complete
MGIAIYDSLDDMESLLADNWTIGSTPMITKSYEQKAVGFVDSRRDNILIYPRKENVQYWGLYGTDHLSEVDVAIEVRTYQNQDHHNNVASEVDRIIKANIRRDGFVDLRILTSLSENDTYRNMFKHTISARYRKLNP